MFLHVNRYKSSRSQIPFKTGVLKNFAIFTGKHLCWSLFLIKFLFNKVSLQMTPTQVLSYEYCKIVRNSFFTEHLRWLLLPLNSNKGKKKKVRKCYHLRVLTVNMEPWTLVTAKISFFILVFPAPCFSLLNFSCKN